MQQPRNEDRLVPQSSSDYNSNSSKPQRRRYYSLASFLRAMISMELKSIYWKTEQYESDINGLKALRREAEAEIKLLNSGNG